MNGEDEELPPLEELDLAEEWEEFPSSLHITVRRREFQRSLREKVSNPEAVDGIGFCDDCGDPEWLDGLARTGAGQDICSSCWDEWYSCAWCSGRFQEDDLYSTLSGSEVCERCRQRHYSYCDHCEGYYPDDYSSEHRHGDGCCASPQVEFSIRNDGCDPLPSDTRVTIELPSGIISSEGLDQISTYLSRKAGYRLYSEDREALGDQWQAKDGNFAKRLSRHMYKKYAAKLTPEVLSQVGCIARDHSNAVAVEIDVTRQLNLPAWEFYHEDSCWWNSYSESRCALKTNGGFGLRSFSGKTVTGRAWVLPLRKDPDRGLVPTFETMTPDAFVVFNGYGDLQGYAAPRILAHMAGWTYRKIGFECSPMYVNAGGYLVAPEVIAQRYENRTLLLSVSQHSNLFDRERASKKEAELALAGV